MGEALSQSDSPKERTLNDWVIKATAACKQAEQISDESTQLIANARAVTGVKKAR